MTPDRWKEIKEVLAAALERTPAERSIFVAEVCGADSALRAEVESLLSYDCGTGASSSQAGFAERRIGMATEQESRRIGPYRIVRELGRGGMGAVYLAERADDQYRSEVAIKLIRPGMDTEFVLRRIR